MSAAPYRCSAASLETGEPAGGTASTVRRFLLLEESGPWGVDAVRDARLPDPVKRRLEDLRDRERIRPLLVRRRADATPGGGVQVYLADATTARLTGTVLRRRRRRRRPGPRCARARRRSALPRVHARTPRRLLRRARPTVGHRARSRRPRAHLGGLAHRWRSLRTERARAPHGLYYGRLEPDDAADFVARHLDGRLDPEHLRGRSTFPFPVQAAEVHLRREIGEDRLDAVRLLRADRDGDDRLVDLAVEEDRYRLRLRARAQQGMRLTCRSTAESVAVTYDLAELTRLPAG